MDYKKLELLEDLLNEAIKGEHIRIALPSGHLAEAECVGDVSNGYPELILYIHRAYKGEVM